MIHKYICQQNTIIKQIGISTITSTKKGKNYNFYSNTFMAYLYIIVEKLKSHQYLMTLDLLKSIGYSFEKRYLTFMLFYVLQLCSFHSFFFFFLEIITTCC